MAKKKGTHHEEEMNESWLLPYSDMMTLLLAVFIVMFAISSVNQAQFNAVMESMYTAFGGTTDAGSPTPLPYPDAGLPNQPEDAATAVAEGEAEGSGKGLSTLYLSLNQYVNENNLTDSIGVEDQGDKVLVTLKNDVFFQPGSAEVSPEMVEQAQQLAQLVYNNQNPSHPFDVIVAGYTDNVPQVPSNWYLSVQRAVNFLVAMLEGSELNPTQFSSRGYGEYMPVADNDTEEGRQKNRRVELQISEDAEQLGAPPTPAPTVLPVPESGVDGGASAPASAPGQ